MPKKINQRPTKSLIFNTLYKNYDHFYSEAKPEIYKSIFELFKEFRDKRKARVSLSISAMIREEKWDTELIFNRDEHIVLKRDLMPFFEDMEEFELCGEIDSLYKEFTLKK